MRRLTSNEQQRINHVAQTFDPLRLKECVLSFPLEKRESVCLELLGKMYEATPKSGSSVKACKTLLEDKFIAFTPSWEQLQSITTRPIGDEETFKYLATTEALPTGFPLRGKSHGGAVAQMCTQKNEQLLSFSLSNTQMKAPLTTHERVQLVATMLWNVNAWWTGDHIYENEHLYFHPKWQEHPQVRRSLRVIEVVMRTPFTAPIEDVFDKVFAPNPHSHRFNPFGLMYLAQQDGVGMAKIVEQLMNQPEAGKLDAQVCLEQMFVCGRHDIAELLSQHKLCDTLKEQYCPTLFKYVQHHTLSSEVKNKGTPKQKLKM